MDYARVGARRLESRNRFHEHLLAYLVFRRAEYGALAGAPALAGLSTGQISEVAALIDETIDELALPIELILRNPGINPWGLASLRAYFNDKPEAGLAKLLPLDPLSDAPTLGEESDAVEGEANALPFEISDAVVANLVAIFTRMSKHLEAPLGQGGAAYANAKLVAQWMRGHPLHRIIDGQIKYWSGKDKTKGVTAIIRETLERVETIARFQAPKYLHAYLDVLRLVLKDRAQEDVLPTTDEFWLYLEFGVSKRTQLSLMSLSLSRSSAIALSVFIKNDDLSEEGCLEWLRGNAWEEFDLPRLVELEIQSALSRRGEPDPRNSVAG